MLKRSTLSPRFIFMVDFLFWGMVSTWTHKVCAENISKKVICAIIDFT